VFPNLPSWGKASFLEPVMEGEREHGSLEAQQPACFLQTPCLPLGTPHIWARRGLAHRPAPHTVAEEDACRYEITGVH
jgi:hypothetical protein